MTKEPTIFIIKVGYGMLDGKNKAKNWDERNLASVPQQPATANKIIFLIITTTLPQILNLKEVAAFP